MKHQILLGSVLGALLLAATQRLSAETVWIDELNLDTVVQDYGVPARKTSLEGREMSIAGKTFERGFGTHAESWLAIRLDGAGRAFSAQVGIDDEVKGRPGGTAEFVVLGDGEKLWSSGLMRVGDAPKSCVVPLAKVKLLELVVTDGEDNNYYDHVDWAEAKIESDGVHTFNTVAHTSGEPYILTPPAPAAPRINGARVFGVRVSQCSGGRPHLLGLRGARGGELGLSLDVAGPELGEGVVGEVGHGVLLSGGKTEQSAITQLSMVCGTSPRAPRRRAAARYRWRPSGNSWTGRSC